MAARTFKTFESVVKRGIPIVSAVSVAIYGIEQSEFGRKKLLALRFSRTITPFKLREDHLYVEQSNLAADIRSAVTSRTFGAKIIYTPPGGGKSTTAKRVIRQLVDQGLVSGVALIKPPSNVDISKPSAWFRSELACFGLETIRRSEHLSDMLSAPMERPYVILIDQVETLQCNDALRRLLKTLAEDSLDCKSFVVIALCSNAPFAYTILNWNGRVKITMTADGRQDVYKWTAVEIDAWMSNYLKHHPQHPLTDDTLYDTFKTAAVKAGSPDFLIMNTDLATMVSAEPPEHIWNRSAENFESQWAAGVKLLRN